MNNFSRGVVLGMLTIGVVAAPGWAKEPAKNAPKRAEAPAPDDAQQQAFIQQVRQNIAALNFQEVTASVLGAQYQKEVNNLQQMQAVFCDTYHLDVTKFRQRKYRFNEHDGTFAESDPAKP